MKTVKLFLTECKNKLTKMNHQLGTCSKLHVVMGNESCDLDSCVSAISYSWLLSFTKTDDDEIIVPLMNIKREEFRLRTDSKFVLEELDIDPKLLTFVDEVDILHLPKTAKLILVDHHALPRWQSALEGHVTKVVDHRPQSRQFPPSVEVSIHAVGSCATLVTEELFRISPPPDLPPDLESLLLGTVLLDTYNMSKERGTVTDRDVEIINKLKKNRTDLDLLYDTIVKARYSVADLSTRDIFFKDPKWIDCSGETKAMFSSLHLAMSDFLARPDFRDAVTSLCDVACLTMIGPVAVDEGRSYRPLAVFAHARPVFDKVCDQLLGQQDLDIKLHQKDNKQQSTLDNFATFRMYNSKASRKQVLPVVTAALKT